MESPANGPGAGGSMRIISWWVTRTWRPHFRQEAADPRPNGDHGAVERDTLATAEGDFDAPCPLFDAGDGRLLANEHALFPGQAAHEGDGPGALDVPGPGVVYDDLVVGDAELRKARPGLACRQYP